MRIVCISDTHHRHDQVVVPEGDMLLCGGDLCGRGTIADVRDFDKWLGKLPHRHKVVIAGNHDWCFEREPGQARACITQAHYLQDGGVTLGGLRIYGSPWQPEFFDWAFNLPRGSRLREKWALIPDDTDILITHGPPHGILDRNDRGQAVGCEELAERVAAVAPRLHLFGHIHEAYGEMTVGPTIYVNASCCDLQYRPCQPPIVIEL